MSCWLIQCAVVNVVVVNYVICNMHVFSCCKPISFGISINQTKRCATWMGCRCGLMPPVVTKALAKCKTREKSLRKDKEREMRELSCCCLPCAPVSFITTKQSKLIQNQLRFQFEQTDIPEVKLNWYDTILTRCSLPFWAVYFKYYFMWLMKLVFVLYRFYMLLKQLL